jgi:hypothetical protein
MGIVAHMRHPRASLLAVLIGVLLLVWVVKSPLAETTHGGNGGAGTALTDSPRSFSIGGIATQPIAPGLRASLDLRMTNPRAAPMSVTDLSVSVQRIRAPNADEVHPCSIGDFVVDQPASDLKITVPAHSTSTLSSLGHPLATWPRVGMRNRPVDQSGCKGASVTLVYSGSGTWAS